MQTNLVAGDSLNYTTSIPAYPPSAGWVAKLRLTPRGAGAAVTITASAAANADVHGSARSAR